MKKVKKSKAAIERELAEAKHALRNAAAALHWVSVCGACKYCKRNAKNALAELNVFGTPTSHQVSDRQGGG